MADSDTPTNDPGRPVVLCMNSRDFRVITRLCRSACRHNNSEILFTFLVDKKSLQVCDVAIPEQTATAAHCDAQSGEDLRIAQDATRRGYAICKAHSHGRMANFSSSDDWNCGTSLHATCAANSVRQESEVAVSVQDGGVYLGADRSIRLAIPGGLPASSADDVRAYAMRTTGESAFFTFNAWGDKPCGVGLRLTTHAGTGEVTSCVVGAEVRIRRRLPRRLQHWTQERIDAEVDAKLRRPNGTPYSRRPTDRWLSHETGDSEISASEAWETSGAGERVASPVEG